MIAPPLSEPQIRRYARHVLLDEVGGLGQRALLGAAVRVEVVGAAEVVALGYLAAAGIGVLVVVADGVVEAAEVVAPPLRATDRGADRAAALAARLPAYGPDTQVLLAAGPAALATSATEAPLVVDAVVDLGVPGTPPWWPGADGDETALALWRGGVAATRALASIVAVARQAAAADAEAPR